MGKRYHQLTITASESVLDDADYYFAVDKQNVGTPKLPANVIAKASSVSSLSSKVDANRQLAMENLAEAVDGVTDKTTINFYITGKIINADGTLSDGDSNVICTDLIAISQNTLVKSVSFGDYATSSKLGLAFYDENQDFISGFKAVNCNGTEILTGWYKSTELPVVPTNAKYIRLAGQSFVGIFPSITTLSTFDVVAKAQENTENYVDGIEGIDERTRNYVPTLADTRIKANGDLATTQYVETTELIPINQEFTSILWGDNSAATTTWGLAFYDENGAYLQGYKANSFAGAVHVSSGVYSYNALPTPPAGAKFVRFSGNHAIGLDAAATTKVMAVYGGVEWLKGKKVLFFGDSITDTNSSNIRYPKYVADYTGCTNVNYAVSASGFGLDGSNTPFGNHDNKIYQQIELAHTNNVDCDFVVVAAGTNDWDFAAVPFGSKSDILLDTMATPSFYWYVAKAVKNLIEYFPLKQWLFITPLPRYKKIGDYVKDQHAENTLQKTLMQYAEAIRYVCDYYSVPYLDMMLKSNMHLENPTASTAYTSDGLHPTARYASEIFAPMVISAIRNLVNEYA